MLYAVEYRNGAAGVYDGKSCCFAHWHRSSSRAQIKTRGGHVERITEIFIIELHIRAR